MSCNLAIIEQVALYLGRPWKVNHLREQSNWRYEIIDGQGRGLFFRYDTLIIDKMFQKLPFAGVSLTVPSNLEPVIFNRSYIAGTACSWLQNG